MISLFSTYFQDNPLEDFKLSAALLYGNILIQKWTNSKSKNKIRFMFEDGNLRTSQSRIPQGPSLSTDILRTELGLTATLMFVTKCTDNKFKKLHLP